MTRRGALKVGYRAASRLGVPLHIAMYIAFACREHSLRYALGFAMVKKESAFQHIFGHDSGGLFPGKPVKRWRYRKLRNHLRKTSGAGANGVGLTQITYYTYILDHAGLWKKRANVYFGIDIFADYVHRLGERTGAGAYNGGEANPQLDYADDLLAIARDIRPRLK